MKIFCMMLVSVLAYSTSPGLYGTSVDTMLSRLTNNRDMWGILLDKGRMRAAGDNVRDGGAGDNVRDDGAGDNVRDENGKMRKVKREGTGLYGSGIDTSQNTYNRLTKYGDIIWGIPDSILDEERIRVADLEAWDNVRDGKIRILKRENTKVGRTKVS